jgi:hypothetical protein
MPSTYSWPGRKENDDGNNSSEMKHKDPPGPLCISGTDSSFLASPAVRYTPYFGQYGVSTTNVSPSGSSTTMLSSPIIGSPNHIGSVDKPPTRIPSQMNQSYISQNQPPLLSMPNLLSLRTAVGENNPDYCRSPLQPSPLQPVSLRSTTHLPPPETMRPLPRRRKRKPIRSFSDREAVLSGEMTAEEQILMQLTEQKNLPWKEVAIRFKEQTGKLMKIPALQMKKKRLVERLRVWTPSEVPYPSLHFNTGTGAHLQWPF